MKDNYFARGPKVLLCDTVFFFLMIIQSCLLILTPLVGESFSVSIFTYAAILCVTIIIGFGVLSRINRVNLRELFLGIILIITIVLSILYGENAISYLVFTSVMNFFVTTAPFFCTKYISQNHFLRYTTKNIAFFQALIFIGISITSKAYMPYYVGNTRISDGTLTLGFSNPNTTGLLLFYVFTLNLFWMNNTAAKRKKLGYIFLLSILWQLMFKTGCRAIIILSIPMIIISFFEKKERVRKACVSPLTMFLSMLFPFIFLYIYDFMQRYYSSLQIMGADIYSRNELFRTAYKDILQSPLLGDVTEHLFANTHNGYLTIMLNIGIVGLIIYLLYVTFGVNQFRKNAIENKQLIPYVFILIIFLYSSVESGCLTGGILFGTNMMMICYLAGESSKQGKTG